VAIRMPGQKLEWNSAKMRIPNCPEAERHVRRAYRDGWRLASV